MRPHRSRLGWLALGHAVLIALFLLLLNIPESNALMLSFSGVTVVAMLVWTAIVESSVVRWNGTGTAGSRVAGGLANLPALVLALLVLTTFWWLGGGVSAWHVAHFGEVDAWLIARANTTDAAWLHRTIDALVFALRWVVGVSLAVALFVTCARDGLGSATGVGWLKRGLSLPLLAIVALVAVAGWQFVPRAIDWRPQWLPANATQIAFAALKGLVLYLLLNAGWLAILLIAARRRVAAPPGAAAAAPSAVAPSGSDGTTGAPPMPAAVPPDRPFGH